MTTTNDEDKEIDTGDLGRPKSPAEVSIAAREEVKSENSVD